MDRRNLLASTMTTGAYAASTSSLAGSVAAADYRSIGGAGAQAVYADFQPSLTLLATAMNATHADRVTIDAGTKAIDTTTANLPQAKSWPGLVPESVSPEHADRRYLLAM
jgi:hypothetical protein